MSNRVAEKLVKLQATDTPALRALWGQVFGRPAPRWTSRELLLRALAYRVQEQAEGGLSKAALKRLASLADPQPNGNRPPRPMAPRLRPATRLVREWRGEVHRVSVLEEGFEYRGARYASLSRIAREITGTRWSGPLFFGLRKAGTQPRESTDGS